MRSSRAGRTRPRQPYFQALEARQLLSTTLLPIADHYDLVFDAIRNQLDIVGASSVYRYDLATKSMLPSIPVGGAPGYGDITSDGRFLYLTDRLTTAIHKVDLAGGTASVLAQRRVAGTFRVGPDDHGEKRGGLRRRGWPGG